MDGGSSINDSIKAAKIFEEAGVDLLDISGGFCGYINPNIKEQGYFSEITEAIKKNNIYSYYFNRTYYFNRRH